MSEKQDIETQGVPVPSVVVADKVEPRAGFAVCETCGEAEASPPEKAKGTKDGDVVLRGYCEPCKDAARAENERLNAEIAAKEAPTVEKWARKHGMLPEQIVPPAPKHKPQKAMRPVHNPKYQKFAAAKHLHGWPQGKEMAEEEFLAAVEHANDPEKNTFR